MFTSCIQLHTAQCCCLKVRGLIFFLNQSLEENIYLVFIQNELHWHKYRLLRAPTLSEKLQKNPLFGPSLIYQLRLFGPQQHPQSGVLLTSLSTWGTENSLVEINLRSTGRR